MHRAVEPKEHERVIIAVLVSAFAFASLAIAQSETDQHRPACSDAHCRSVESFVKANYCGASPFGNGPDDGCEIEAAGKPRTGIEVVAAYECHWSESTQAALCRQHGQPPATIRNTLIVELHRVGLPAKAIGETYFAVWKSAHSGWSIAEAYYSRSVGSDIELCEVIAVVDESSHVIVLHELPFQKTDVDKPAVTQWALVDLADVEGNGQEDVVLEGDAYENHWLEVIRVQQGSAKTIFSGLGYYL